MSTKFYQKMLKYKQLILENDQVTVLKQKITQS